MELNEKNISCTLILDEKVVPVQHFYRWKSW